MKIKKENNIEVFIEVPAIRPGGGPFGYTYNFLKGFEKLDEDTKSQINISTLANKDDSRTQSKNSIARINLLLKLKVRIKKYIPDSFYRAKLKLSKKWKQISKSDIVIFHGFQNSLVIEEASKIAKTIYMPHCPTIAADEYLMNSKLYHTEFSEKEYQKVIEIERNLIKCANNIVFASKGAADEYFKNFGIELSKKNIEYIASGIDLPENAYSEDHDNKIYEGSVLFAGRYVSHKGYDLYCAAAKEITRLNNTIKFVSIGGGPIKNNEFVNDLSWQENPYPFIQQASIIVIPNKSSYYDLFPLECAALGKPIVMTKVGGNIDQLKELPDSLGCTTDLSDLSNAIIKAYNLKRENPDWGSRNKLKYHEFYNSEAFTKRWINYLIKISKI